MHEPDREKLFLYIDGSLTKEESEQVEGHLSTCAECRALCAEIARRGARVRRIVQGIPEPVIDEEEAPQPFSHRISPEARERILTELYCDQLVLFAGKLWLVLGDKPHEFSDDNLENLTRVLTLRFLQEKCPDLVSLFDRLFGPVFRNVAREQPEPEPSLVGGFAFAPSEPPAEMTISKAVGAMHHLLAHSLARVEFPDTLAEAKASIRSVFQEADRPFLREFTVFLRETFRLPPRDAG